MSMVKRRSASSDDGGRQVRWQALREQGLRSALGVGSGARVAVNDAGSVTEQVLAEAVAGQRRNRLINRTLDAGVLLALIAAVVYFSVASPNFLTANNLANLGISVAVDGIMAAGITMCLIGGQLDLSIGSVLGLSTVIVGLLWVPHGLSLGEVMVIVIACGAAVGLVNSFLVIELGINSIITTLAMGIAVEGVANVVSSGQLINLNNPHLTNLVNARPAGIPVPVIVMAVIYVAVYVFLTHTRAGWHVYATGASRTAAARSGIRVRALYRLVFVGSGALAAVAGLIYAGQGSTAESSYGQTDTFLVITAVLLGGIGLGGGAGRIERTLVGVLFIGVLTNGLILLNVQSFYQQLAQGLAFIAAVALGGIKERRGG